MPWTREQVPGIDAPRRPFSGQVFSVTIGDFDFLTSRSSCLSLSELRRAENFRRRPDAAAFIARRVFLRETLAANLGVSPRDLTFDVSRNGKPELRHGKDHLWFSQSATTGRTVVALSRNGEVGIDIERLDRPLDFGLIANRWFTPQEVSRIEQCSSDDTIRLEFIRIWTAREAAAKLTGEGMALALPGHESFVDPMRVALPNGELPIWIDVSVESPYLVSVAWSAIECQPRL
jgi:4'-phosphopantetheinyl transferase